MSSDIKFGYFVFSNPTQIVTESAVVERVGFDSLWISDHFMHWYRGADIPEPFTVLGSVAVSSRRLRLGTCVTDPCRRHPALIAQTIATLDHLSNGRMNLGLGCGEVMNTSPFGISFNHPLSRLKEAVAVIKNLWQAQRDVSFEGESFRLKQARLQIFPAQKPYPPIYLSASGLQSLSYAGEVADGWLPWIHTPRTYEKDLQHLRRAAVSTGRRWEDVDTAAFIYSSIADTRGEAEKAVAPLRRALVLEERILKEEGAQVSLPKGLSYLKSIPNEEFQKEIDTAAAQIPVRILERTGAFGSPEDCIKSIERFIQAGAKHIIISNFGPQRERLIEIYGQEIIPYFKRAK